MKQITRMLATVVALGIVMNLGGCLVAKSELDTANNYNNQLVKDRDDLRGQLAEADAQIASLERQLGDALSDGGSGALVANLREDLAGERAKYDTLKASYDRLADDRTSLPMEVSTALEELALEHPDMIEYVSSRGMVKFKSDLTFPKGSDELKASASAALKEVATILNSTDASGYNIYVAGHTDDMPITPGSATARRHPNNWSRSVHRAVVVQEALENAGVDPERLAVVGFGEYQPAETNAPNHQGNAANRRVELWIVLPGQFMSVD